MRLRNLLMLIALPAALVTACGPDPEPTQATRLGAALGGEPDAGYARALTPREFQFPADHGAHPDFRNEWWYLTGNLAAPDGRRFGYQFTLFRIALSPEMPPAGLRLGQPPGLDGTRRRYRYRQSPPPVRRALRPRRPRPGRRRRQPRCGSGWRTGSSAPLATAGPGRSNSPPKTSPSSSTWTRSSPRCSRATRA